MKTAALALVGLLATVAGAQDTSFTRLAIRGGVLTNPVVRGISDDWKPRTGFVGELASNVGIGELGLAIGHLPYSSRTDKPAFTGTVFSLQWMVPLFRAGKLDLSAGPRLSDIRMDFDDPSLVGGLQTEEEVMLGALLRGEYRVARGFGAFVDAHYGVLMLAEKTPMLFVNAGIVGRVRMPGWMGAVLR